LSSHLADFQIRVSTLFSSFLVKLAFLPDQTKDLSMQSSYLDLLNLPYRRGLGLGLFKVEPVLSCRWGQDCVLSGQSGLAI